MAKKVLLNRTTDIRHQLSLIESIVLDGNGNVWNALDRLDIYVADLRKHIGKIKKF